MSRLTFRLSALLQLAIVGCNDYGTTPVPPPGAPELELTPERPTTLDELRVEVTDDPQSTVTRNEFSWFVDGLRVEEYEGLTIPASVTTKGQRWEVIVTPYHGNLRGVEANATVRIVNSPPEVRLSWETSPASTRDDLVLLAEIIDADDDPVTLTASWTRNGTPVPHDGMTIDAGLTHRGDVWVVTVTPNDGEEDGVPAELSISIDNMVPTVGSVTLAPDPAFTTTDLVATAHDIFDPDDDPVTLSYAWYVGGSLVPDQHDRTLDSSFFVKGEEVEVEVTPNDGEDDGAPVRSARLIIQNSPPSATSAVIEPSEADSITDLSCTGDGFFDADGDPEGYLYAWFINGVEHSAGPSLDSSATRRGDTVACVVTPFDGEDEGEPVFSSAITITNAPPSLASVAIEPEDPRVTDTLSVTLGAYSDPDGDEVSFRYAWEVDGELLDLDDETLDGSHFIKGQDVVVIVTPTDGMLDGPPVRSDSVTVANTPPVLSDVGLGPSPAYTRDPIVATASATDADGDPLSFSYRWYINDVDSGSDSDTLPHDLTAKHDVVRVEVTATDGEDVTAPLSATLTVLNSPPSATSATVEPTAPDTSSTLTCVGGGFSDDDGDPESFRYRWTVDGVEAGTGATLTSSAFARGNSVVCIATPFDGEEEGEPVFSAPVSIVNAPPFLAEVHLEPEDPRVTDTLSVSLGDFSDPDGDEVSFRYAWEVDGELLDLDDETLDGSHFIKGQDVVVIVTPTDGMLDGPPVRSEPVTAVNTPPVLTGVGIGPSPAFTLDPIVATASATDADGDPLSFSYRWFVNDVDTGIVSSTLPHGLTSKHAVVRVEVTATDGDDVTAPLSATLTVLNTPPSATSATVEPTAPDTSSTLTCVGGGFSDDDGDPESFRYRWTVDGVEAGTGATLTSSAFARGNSVVCIATPFDGEEEGEPVFSAPVSIVNAPPFLAEVHLEPEDPRVTDTLSVSLGDFSDPDGDEVFFHYAWEIDGELIDADSETLDGSHFAKGQEIVVIVTPTDGMLDGPPVRSEPVTAVNTPPVLTGVGIGPSPAFTLDPIVATASATDADGDPLSFSYRWFVNDVDTGIVSSTLPHGLTSKHAVVRVEVTATDGDDVTAPLSATLTVLNTPPSATSASIDPPDPITTTTLTCVGSGFTDADGDPPGFDYRWTVNGSPAGTGATLASSAFVRNDMVICHARPFDGEDHGTEISSTPVSIRNSPPSIGSVTLSPPSPRVSDIITAGVSGVVDLDGDPVSFRYSWTLNGSPTGHTGSSLATVFRRGDRVRVTVIPNDGFEDGTPVTSPEVTIANTPPVVTALTLDPRPAYTTTSVTATPSASDADGDALSYTYGWYINGTRHGTTTNTLASSAFVKGNTIYADVVAWDGYDSSTTFTSATLTVSNSAPTTPGVPSLTPTSPLESQNLVCTRGTASTDPDGDPITYQAQFRSGSTSHIVTVTGSTATLSSASTSAGQTWRCRMRALDDDGGESSWSGDSAAVTIRSPWAGERRFTNCGRTGTTGPTTTQCSSAYSSTPLAGEVSVSEGMQEWTVPVTGTYRIWACGAAGMSAEAGRRGGRGACVRGDFSLTSGQRLMIVVGQNGTEDSPRGQGNGGGGGGTWVLRNTGFARWSTSNHLMLVAGGGAGTRRAASQNGCDGRTTLDAGTGVASSTHGCGALSTSHRGRGGPTPSSSWGSSGGGWLSDGIGDSSWGSGGRGFPNRLVGSSAISCGSSTGGFGGGGTGNGCWGGGGGGGYGGGQGGWIAGGGGSYNVGSSTATSINSVGAHGYVTINLL